MTVKNAIDNMASDMVSWTIPVVPPNASFTAGIAGMKKCNESGPMNVTDTNAIKKYQRGRNKVAMKEIMHGSMVLV